MGGRQRGVTDPSEPPPSLQRDVQPSPLVTQLLDGDVYNVRNGDLQRGWGWRPPTPHGIAILSSGGADGVRDHRAATFVKPRPRLRAPHPKDGSLAGRLLQTNKKLTLGRHSEPRTPSEDASMLGWTRPHRNA